MGEPKHIQRYCPKLAPSLTCLADEQPGEQAYRTYGLSEGGMKEFVSLDVLKAGMRAFSKGNMGGVPTANPMMMPGTFIVNPNGKLIYTYYSKHAGDHPEIADIVAAVREEH